MAWALRPRNTEPDYATLGISPRECMFNNKMQKPQNTILQAHWAKFKYNRDRIPVSKIYIYWPIIYTIYKMTLLNMGHYIKELKGLKHF